MTMKGPERERGRVVDIILSRPITFNSSIITKAKIEIDHINFGLNKKTKKLNEKKRSHFTVRDIEKFIKLLDGEDVVASDYKGKISEFNIRINCPISGQFYGKEFIMIFDTHYDKSDEIHTITIFPGW
jgi:hypothetical protein